MRNTVILSGLCCLLILGWSVAILGAGPGGAVLQEDIAGAKEFVVDGSIVHDVGNLHLNITNWGLIGSRPGTGAPYSEAPSARWPGANGDDYLFAAGLWIGGRLLGETLVSTGQYEAEFHPSPDPGDTIFSMAMGDPGGARYPDPFPDDDGDSLEDEDPKNGLDDDGDGLIDEDFAAISEQHFRCVNSDMEASVQEMYPDHTPLGLQVIQQTFQWSDPLAHEFVGFDLTIRNVGVHEVNDIYLGFFADCDIPAVMGGNLDDMAGSFQGLVQAFDGSWVPVSLGYMYDAAAIPVGGYIGLLFLDHTTDATGNTAPPVAQLTSFQTMRGSLQFEQGGDPTNDFERYELLSDTSWDPDTPPGQQDDYRILIASGPFPSLAPGAELSYQVALIMGDGLDQLLWNAANAAIVYAGAAFDRDGDPGNGDEFIVRWLHPEDVPVSTVSGSLRTYSNSYPVHLVMETNLDSIEPLCVVRRVRGDLPERRWQEGDMSGIQTGPEGTLAELFDDDPGGWPRIYELVFLSAYRGDVVLDTIEISPAMQSRLTLVIHPNPFNPRVEISYQLPTAGTVRLSIFDIQGRLVQQLLDEVRPVGPGTVIWPGDDGAGRPVASGIYHVLLQTERDVVRRNITLVR